MFVSRREGKEDDVMSFIVATSVQEGFDESMSGLRDSSEQGSLTGELGTWQCLEGTMPQEALDDGEEMQYPSDLEGHMQIPVQGYGEAGFNEAVDPAGEALEGLGELRGGLVHGLVRSPSEAGLVEPMDAGGEALEGLGELRGDSGAWRRVASFSWWETGSVAETLSEPETYNSFTEYALDSEDTSVSSTRCSTSNTGTTPGGSVSRLGRRSQRGFSVVVRGERSPHSVGRSTQLGYRGRSMTRRERGGRSAGAAMRHRHPTHTPTRRPETPTRFLALGAGRPRTGTFRGGTYGGVYRRAGSHVGTASRGSAGDIREIGQLREEPAETAL